MTAVLPKELYYQIFDKIKDAKTLVRLSQTCKSNNYIYKNNETYKAKCELSRYQVDYKDPTNFIYIYNEREIPFTPKGEYDLIEILKIYMLQFDMKEIKYTYRGITSFPVYPTMIKCHILYTLGPKLFGTLN
jgi:hypothetical protein